jgi:outer membrane biogenesis lipoprotein LolB
MLSYGEKMKILVLLTVSLILSACVDVNQYPINNTTQIQKCNMVEIPVYGHADLYRDGNTIIRVKQTAYTEKQWRCN